MFVYLDGSKSTVQGRQMGAVQLDNSETSEWTYIQIGGESGLICTVQLDERPNKCPYTINLDVQITPFGLESLYGSRP